ncbi:MAG: hypothetical protein ACLSHC_01925 [Bilophila wadsworthia]
MLQLTFSIYMLQVYDKVLTSYNLSTWPSSPSPPLSPSLCWRCLSGSVPAFSFGPALNSTEC